MRRPAETLLAGRTALVTGASSGIGAEFARQLAVNDANLVLVARRRDRLDALAADLRRTHHIAADIVVADLSQPGAGATIAQFVHASGRDIDVLVNNAGFGVYHRLAETDDVTRERLLQLVQIQCSATVDLTTRFLPGMLLRDRGLIVNVASTAAFQPVPHMAVYGASKAFVLSFSEALWAEVRASNVRVLALCPGTTATEFAAIVDAPESEVGREQTVDQVVNVALRALTRRGPTVVSGAANVVQARVPSRLLPRGAVAAIVERTMRPHTRSDQLT